MAFVLDCFVATAWTFADEATDAANRLREALVDAPVFVPALWPVEMANALLVATRRGRIAHDEWPAIVIRAGMDTFIWPKTPPHTRSVRAWKGGLPYSRDEWLSVFPDGMRRLITPAT